MMCFECENDLIHCHDVSIEHGDGTTECMDQGCTLAHELHGWQLPCNALEPPCPCVPEDAPPPAIVLGAAA